MDTIATLTKIFERFPGIGPRQAGRFVYHLLRSSPTLRRELVNAVRDLEHVAKQCTRCFRYHSEKRTTCDICEDARREDLLLMVVASDADILALERSGTYRGHYFVLGGTISLGTEKNTHLRMRELTASLSAHPEVKEIILAFPANPEGDATAMRVREELAQRAAMLRVTSLGRGLSSGSELEYADPETLRNALDNRK